MTYVTCRLTVKNRDQSGTLRSVIEHGLPFLYSQNDGRIVVTDSLTSFHPVYQ